MPHSQPLVLLGIPSGSVQRRASLRCTFRTQSCARCRWLFLVGDHPKPPDANWRDVLHLKGVREAQQSYLTLGNRTNRPGKELHGTLTATLTTYLKVAFFLEYAASVATEPYIARADDDTFISLHALERFALALPAH